MELATEDDLDAYRAVNNQPEPPIAPGTYPGSRYNHAVGKGAETETWERYPPCELPGTWQQPYDGVIAVENGKELGFAEDLRQVQVKTRTWEKKSGGTNYYNITLSSHQQMEPDSFYHFWIHTVTDDLAEETADPTRQIDLYGRPVTDDTETRTPHDLREAMIFHADAVFTWEEIDAVISHAQETWNAGDGMDGTGVSTDSYDNPRIDIAVPLLFDYKNVLETAKNIYNDEKQARQDALRRIDTGEELENATFYT